MTYTVLYVHSANIFTVTFDDNERCTSFLQQMVYESAALAQEDWAEEMEGVDDPENWSITSNVITWNRTDQFKGRTKQNILDILENY